MFYWKCNPYAIKNLTLFNIKHIMCVIVSKGTYYAKITLIRCLNTDVWPQCVNKTVYNVKNPPTNCFIKPINHEQSLQKSGFRFSLCSRHRGGKVSPICDTLCPISINTALREKQRSAIAGDIYTVSAKEALKNKCCVLGCTSVGRYSQFSYRHIADTRYYRACVGVGKRETLCTCHRLFHNYLVILNRACVRERERAWKYQ